MMQKIEHALVCFAVLSTMHLLPAGASAASADRPAPVRLLPLKNIRVDDAFWSLRLRTYTEKTIPHSWQYMAWELRALRHANGLPVDGELNCTWGEANLYKFIETCAYSLAMHPDSELEKKIDDVIALVAGAQRPDGYVHAYITNSGKPAWDRDFLDGSHDGYVLGHMIEAAIEYHAATGKKALLDVACKAAAQAWDEFLGPKGRPGFCGHAELEMALVELYRVVPDQRFLDLAKAFIEWRGRQKVKPAGPTPRAYFQDEVPFRMQKSLDGHAVPSSSQPASRCRHRDPRLRLSPRRQSLWEAPLRRMYITGSRFRRMSASAKTTKSPTTLESCAACGLADFAQRMFMLERTAETVDVLERVLYNAILHGISLDGTATYYQNPLSDRDNQRYNSWVCCPPNLSRTLLQAPRYAWAHTADEVYVNLAPAAAARS